MSNANKSEGTTSSNLPKEMVFGSIMDRAHAGEDVTQEYYDSERRKFADLAHQLMPPVLVAQGIKNKVDQDNFYLRLSEFAPYFLLNRMIGSISEELRGTLSLEERKQTATKFSQEEILDFLKFSIEYPDVIIAISTLQVMIGDFIHEVTQNSIPKGGELDRYITKFRYHFEGATNPVPTLGPAIYLHMPKTGNVREDFQGINQDVLKRAFEFLETCGAFMDDSRVDTPVVARCPAHGYLRKLIVEEEALHAILRTLQQSREKHAAKPSLQSINFSLARKGVGECAQTALEVASYRSIRLCSKALDILDRHAEQR